MCPKRVLVGYGVDVDAIANPINTKTGQHVDSTEISRGVFAGTFGVQRLVKLFEKNNIKATFFTPIHSLLTFSESMNLVKEKGHEFGVHGFTHESFSGLTYEQHVDVIKACVQELEKFTGKKPKGFTAPSWTTNDHTVKVLEEFGFVYDHSFMYQDSQMHYLPYSNFRDIITPTDYAKDASHWMKPMMGRLKHTKIVEVPASWNLDDWPPMNSVPLGKGFTDPYVVEKMWKDQFTYHYENNDTFIFTITIHPDVSGKPHILQMHQRLIDFINSHEGIEWHTMEEMAEEFVSGKFPGVAVDAGYSGFDSTSKTSQ